jgi:predicted ATP-grasp superfamily ATP-dependent carboligase
VVLPCSDRGLDFLARNRPWLVELGHRPVEANDALVLDLLDKGRTYRLAAAAGVDAPRTIALSGPDDIDEAVATLGFPCALKATRSHRAPASFRAKGVVVHSAAELTMAVAASGGAVVATEIVPGPDDAFCSYYTYLVDGEPLFHFTKRKLRQYPVRWGTGTYHVSDRVPEAQEVGLRLFQAAGLVGLGNVEFKRDERDHKLKLIECNLRLTAADPMIQACGLDLPGLLYDRALGRDTRAGGRFRQGVRQWHPLPDVRALFDYRRDGALTTGAWAKSLLHPWRLPLFSVDDPRPSLANARLAAGRAVRRVRA